MAQDRQRRRVRAASLGAVAVIVAAAAMVTVAAARVTTIAGSGAPGFSGDGGPAALAKLNGPHAVTSLSGGAFLVIDAGNQRIRRVAADGTITTVAGDGTAGWGGDGGRATAAKFHDPQDVSTMPDGSFLIADTGNHRIRRVAADGLVTTVAGSGAVGPGAGGYAGDGGPATAARLNSPHGVAALLNGDFLVADSDNNRIRHVRRDGIITTIAGGGPIGATRGVHSGNGAPATYARINRPQDVAQAPDGTIVIADTGNSRIRRVDRKGRMQGVAGSETAGYGGDGGPAEEARLNSPRAVVPTADGGLLVADAGNDRVRHISVGGRITTAVGGSVLAPLTLYRSSGVAVFNDGFLVADEGNHRVLHLPLPLDLFVITRGLRGSRGAKLRLRYLVPVRARMRIELSRGQRVVRRLTRNALPGRNFVTLPRWMLAGTYTVSLRAQAPDGQVRTARVTLTVVN